MCVRETGQLRHFTLSNVVLTEQWHLHAVRMGIAGQQESGATNLPIKPRPVSRNLLM